MEATLRTAEVPPAFRGPETNIVAIDAAKKKTEPRLTIDFTASRARIVLASGGFVLPEDTALRARSDRYGHFLLLPGDRQYRFAAPGSLRALLGERRIDVEPLAARGRRRARRRAPAARLSDAAHRGDEPRGDRDVFELARVADAGEGARSSAARSSTC